MKVLDTDLQLVIPERIFEMVMYWVDKSPIEISGVGNIKVRRDEPSVMDVTAVTLAGQVNSATQTDITAEELGAAMHALRREKGVTRWFWHSHVDMGVWWSGTDIQNMRDSVGDGWIVETVFDKSRDFRSAYVIGKPFMAVDKIETIIESAYSLPQRDVRFCEREYRNKIHILRAPSRSAISLPLGKRNIVGQMPNAIAQFDNALAADHLKTHDYTDPAIPDKLYYKKGIYRDKDGVIYQIEEDEYHNVWLMSENNSFLLEDIGEIEYDEEDNQGQPATSNHSRTASAKTT
jgi:proteasome lid subunit RPN8/RPN11